MTLWKSVDFASLLDRESSRPITSLKIFEAVDRDPAGTGGKLEKSALLLGIPRSDNFPEILDNLVLFLIAAIIRMLLPILDVDICNAAYEELKLTFVEDVNEISGYQLIEAGDEGIELLFNAFLNLPFRDKSNARD